MKLLRAKFQNFRLLRDLELEFSRNPERHLTIIRAANDSGKTTILQGLQWALYGDEALPNKGKDFRLHPIDWDISEQGKRVSIVAIVEFELTTYRQKSDKVQESHLRYRLVRSVSEYVDCESPRSASTVTLFELKENGTSPVHSPESLIRDALPPELREVFFTDGDRALSFIEADMSLTTKRVRVEQAIRSLLGLGVIEDAVKHLRKSAAEVNKKAKQISDDNILSEVASHLEVLENNRVRLEKDLVDAEVQFSAIDKKMNEVDHDLGEALQKGNKDELRKELELVRGEKKQIDNLLKEASKKHSELFRSQSIVKDILTPVLTGAFERLEKLHTQGKIPITTIPVLHDRLEGRICICGETLEPGDPHGEKRRTYIENLINDNRQADEIQKVLTSLYYEARLQQSSIGSTTWLEDYKKVQEHRDSLENRRSEMGRRYRSIEQRIDSLPDTDIQGLQEIRLQYKEQRDRYLVKQSSVRTELANLKREKKELESKRDRLLRKQEKGARILAEKKVTQDMMEVLKSSYKRITNEELGKVGDLMNKIFLEMIGVDPEQGAIIRRTEINQEFDILVYGPNDRVLNPDRDLNGASRRALTIAFILALSKVSGVKAFNVIDTPLGMTSGFVKRSILRAAVRESVQLIMFLTHDEIIGCEDIINEAAGVVFTLTNPAHYPKMLINDPGIAERKVLRCDCDHTRNCTLCQRRRDAEAKMNI